MDKVTLGIVSFLIANALVSMLATYIYRLKDPKNNKYVTFCSFFFGYCLFFYLISKK